MYHLDYDAVVALHQYRREELVHLAGDARARAQRPRRQLHWPPWPAWRLAARRRRVAHQGA